MGRTDFERDGRDYLSNAYAVLTGCGAIIDKMFNDSLRMIVYPRPVAVPSLKTPCQKYGIVKYAGCGLQCFTG